MMPNTLTAPCIHVNEYWLSTVSYTLLEYDVTRRERKWRMASTTLLEAIRHFRSVVMDAGSRGTTACACTPMLYISGLCEGCTVANEIDYAWTSIHDNGQGVDGVWCRTSIAHSVLSRKGHVNHMVKIPAQLALCNLGYRNYWTSVVQLVPWGTAVPQGTAWCIIQTYLHMSVEDVTNHHSLSRLQS